MTGPRADGPGVRFPPPILLVLGFGAGWLLERGRPLPLVPVRWMAVSEMAGWLLLALGLGVMLWGLLTFRRARTAVIPNRPAARLVTQGPYQFTRNPMYVGLTAAYVGLTLLASSVWPLLLLPLALGALYALVIRREERYLAAEFGPAYEEYRRGVRRWL